MGRAPWWLPWAVYAPLGAIGAGVAWFSRGAVVRAPPSWRFSPHPWLAQLIGVVLALLVTVFTVVATRWLVTRTRWARRLHATLRGALLGAGASRLLVLAIGSAVAEELFFRAALLPLIGLVASTLIFGVLHIAPGGTYLGWMVWASLMGFVFALLYLGSGSLLAPIVAHAAINYENMQYLCNYDPTLADTGRTSTHEVRARRL